MARQPLQTDTILGDGNDQYRIESVLSAGGFGITYIGRSLRLDREVAIKEYFPQDFAIRDGTQTIRSLQTGSKGFFEQGKRHFIEEARTLAKFRHEHVVRVLTLIEQNNSAYMILEFEEGRKFKDWIRDLSGRRPTQRELDDFLVPMLSALEYIHDKGIFHRDIAPDNIIIRRDGKPVLIDFGAARQLAGRDSQTVAAIVKHGYSPPEQYVVETRLQGAWSDIYALCATFFHAMMGRPPDEASRRGLGDTLLPLEDHLDDEQLRMYRPSFIAGLEAGLMLKPKDRPQSIAELREIILDGADYSSPQTGRQTAPQRAGAASGPVSQPRGRTGPRTGRDQDDFEATAARLAEPTGRAGRGPAPTATRARTGRSRVAEVDDDAQGRRSRRLDRDDTGHDGSPEVAGQGPRLVGLAALGLGLVAALLSVVSEGRASAAGFIGLVVAMLGVSGAAVERLVAVQRAYPEDRSELLPGSAAVVTAGLGIIWLAQLGFLATGPVLPLLVLAAVLALVPSGAWMPVVLTMLGILHAIVVVDVVIGNLDQAGRSLPVLATAYLVVSAAAIGISALYWMGRTRRIEERPA